MAILVTRPQPGAAETAARLLAIGRESVVAPVTEIVPLAPELPSPETLQAVLVTSANALAALERHRMLPLLAVGDATAAKARAAGFERVHSAGRDAGALAELVRRLCHPAGPAVLVAGQQGEGRDLGRALAEAGFAVCRADAYAVRRMAELPQPARAALCGCRVEAALFFSPATARAFVELAAGLPAECFATVAALAISAAAAAPLGALPWRGITVAAAPNQDELLGLLA